MATIDGPAGPNGIAEIAEIDGMAAIDGPAGPNGIAEIAGPARIDGPAGPNGIAEIAGIQVRARAGRTAPPGQLGVHRAGTIDDAHEMAVTFLVDRAVHPRNLSVFRRG